MMKKICNIKSRSKLGKIKDECGGKVPHYFYELMAKTLNWMCQTANGVLKNVVDKEF